MEDIEKLQELLDLIKDKADSTPAEKLAMISVVGGRYKEIFDVDIIGALIKRIERQVECDLVELFFKWFRLWWCTVLKYFLLNGIKKK